MFCFAGEVDFLDDDLPPLALVPIEHRGSLPFALVHGESLVAAASWSVQAAGAELYDSSIDWSEIRASGRALVVHDPLCPLAPVDFLAEAIDRCRATGRAVIAFRPVTDTVKEAGATLGVTVDRENLRMPASPIVLPADLVAGVETLETAPGRLAAQVAAIGPVEWLPAPALAAPIRDQDGLVVLEALSRASRRE